MKSSAVSRVLAGFFGSAVVLAGLAVSAAPAMAATTVSVKVVSGVLQVTDSSFIRHSLLVDDDGPGAVYVYDAVAGNALAPGAGCARKTLAGRSVVSCPRSGFSRVSVTLGAGDDNVTYSVDEGARTDGYINLGAGNDVFVGPMAHIGSSVASVTIYGGFGDDQITGGSASDSLNGGAGRDTIDGYLGKDILNGDEDNDYINAKDSAQDTINCGESFADSDTARVDYNNLDLLIGASCEHVTTA